MAMSDTRKVIEFGARALKPGFRFGGPFATKEEAREAAKRSNFTNSLRTRVEQKGRSFFWTGTPNLPGKTRKELLGKLPPEGLNKPGSPGAKAAIAQRAAQASTVTADPTFSAKDKADAKKVADRLYKITEAKGFKEDGLEKPRVNQAEIKQAVKGTGLTQSALATGLLPHVMIAQAPGGQGFFLRRRDAQGEPLGPKGKLSDRDRLDKRIEVIERRLIVAFDNADLEKEIKLREQLEVSLKKRTFTFRGTFTEDKPLQDKRLINTERLQRARAFDTKGANLPAARQARQELNRNLIKRDSGATVVTPTPTLSQQIRAEKDGPPVELKDLKLSDFRNINKYLKLLNESRALAPKDKAKSRRRMFEALETLDKIPGRIGTVNKFDDAREAKRLSRSSPEKQALFKRAEKAIAELNAPAVSKVSPENAAKFKAERQAREAVRMKQHAEVAARPPVKAITGVSVTRAKARFEDADAGRAKGKGPRRPERDLQRTSAVVAPSVATTERDERLQKRWFKHPGKLDFQGVDTKGARKPKFKSKRQKSQARAGRV